MLSFFRVNAAYHTFTLAILLMLLRLPLALGGIPMLTPELQWMLVGEKMGNGFVMYRDIWDNTSPLASVVYWSINLVFGRSTFAFHVVAVLVGVFQGVYFNYITKRHQLFADANYVPGALYMLFLNLSFDCTTLSPMLMATTFLLLALGGVIKQLGREGATDEVFEMGFYISLAVLLDFSTIVFAVWLLVSLLLYTGANFRHIALTVFGLVFPIALTLLIFFFRGTSDDMLWNLLRSIFQFNVFESNTLSSLLVAFGLPLVISALGLFKTIAGRFNTFQNRCQQIMVWWVIIGVFTIFLLPSLAPMNFVWLVPPMAFFSTNFFIIWQKRKWVAEIAFVALFVGILFVELFNINGSFTQKSYLSELRIKESLLPAEIKNKRILVVGNAEGEYKDNIPTTCYLNWNLAKYDLQKGDSYESVISIFDNFTTDPPQYIIDKEEIMPTIFKRVPELGHRYKTTAWKNIYEKI